MDEKTALIAPIFTEETVSSSMHRLYAAKLKSAGETGLAQLLGALASAEEVHARRMLMHLRAKMGNLDEYIKQVTEEKLKAYSTDFPQIAEALSGIASKQAKEVFEQFGQVAKNHHDPLAGIKGEETGASVEYYFCSVCGYIAKNEPPEKCPVCGAVKGKFRVEA